MLEQLPNHMRARLPKQLADIQESQQNSDGIEQCDGVVKNLIARPLTVNVHVVADGIYSRRARSEVALSEIGVGVLA